MLIGNSFAIKPIQLHQSLLVSNPIEFLSGFVLIAVMDGVHLWAGQRRIDEWLSDQPAGLRWGLYLLIFCAILYLGIPPQRQFIYFEF